MRVLTGILAAALLFVGAGCTTQQALAQVESGKLLVCASFYTMADFTGKIAGDRADVRTLVPVGADAHDWEPTTQDILLLEQADLLILNGAGYEHWTDSVLPALENDRLVVVTTSDAVALLEGEDHGDHKHEHDPHVWLNPLHAEQQMAAIRDALIAVDEENSKLYNSNYKLYSKQLQNLNTNYHNVLNSLPNKEIVVAHEAFGYLCHEYGLHQVGVEGLAPEGEPNPAKMAEVISFAKERQIKVIFFEESASPKVAEAIAREIGAETAVLNPIEGLTQEQVQAGTDYFSLMEENLAQLEYALS